MTATCIYPKCNCPFDAPSDPNWCARGLPHVDIHLQAIVRSSIHAYKCALAGFPCEPGYTEHELMAWEIGRKEGGWEGKH